MASVSISLTVDQATVTNPDSVVASTNAPGAGDIELRVNMAKFTSIEQIGLAVDQFELFLYNAYYGPETFGVL
jgi:hypothetical protein